MKRKNQANDGQKIAVTSDAILETMIDGVGIADVNGNIIQANNAFARMLGFRAPKDTIGESIISTIAEKDIPRVVESFKKCLTTEIITNFELSMKTKDGTEFPVSLNATALKDEKGEVVGMVAVIRDITERKKSEEKVVLLAKFPSENPNPVMRISKDGTILYANKTASPVLQMWGIREGQRLPEYGRKLLEEAFSSGKVSAFEDSCPDGRILFVTLAPVPETDYANAYAIDVTERKRTEETLQEKMNDLERFNRLAVGRELRMVELKREINALLRELEREEKYESVLDTMQTDNQPSRAGVDNGDGQE